MGSQREGPAWKPSMVLISSFLAKSPMALLNILFNRFTCKHTNTFAVLRQHTLCVSGVLNGHSLLTLSSDLICLRELDI